MKKAALLVALTLCLPAFARQFEDVTYPDKALVEGKQLTLTGMGLRTKWMFHVYVAGLYLEDPSKEPVHTDMVRQIRLHLLRDLGPSKISEAIEEGFEHNSKAQMPVLKDRLEKLKAAIPAVKKGQELMLTYVPGKGTTLAQDGKALTTLEGKDFADALFAVWLGPQPVNEDLKKALLGQ